MLLIGFILLTNMTSFGQGLTSSAMNGVVTSSKNETLPGASVVAVHVPTGSKYGTITQSDGRFNIPNVRAGGPYTLTISFVGYKTEVIEKIMLALGSNQDINVVLQESSQNLEEIKVVGTADKTFNSGRTGASTNISVNQINSLPSISRSISDITRLTPQLFGNSFSGTNNKYNNFSLNGTVNNDVFGLTSNGMNGGQAGTQPISLDAIQELQVVIAPYDVRQSGFTGGGINAITKSGTNDFKGTAFFVGNNQNFVGKSVIPDANGNYNKVATYNDYQAGFSVGGPIIKNKLFFYANLEMERKSVPSVNTVGNGSLVPQSAIDSVNKKLNQLGLVNASGGTDAYTNQIQSNKFFASIDWNINDNNKLSITDNYVNASSDIRSNTANALYFDNCGYTFASKTNTFVAQLFTRIGAKFSNELRFGYTQVRDSRQTMGDPMPYIVIRDPSLIGGSSNSINMGTEYSSIANKLNQDIITLNDNFTMFLGRHTVTAGINFEDYSFGNLFIQSLYGNYTYSSLAAFMAIGTTKEGTTGFKPTSYSLGFANTGYDPRWMASWSAYQAGVYLQDEYNVMKGLKVTYGVRIDIPVFPMSPAANQTFDTTTYYKNLGVKTENAPKSTPMFSPRIGFNYDPMGNRTVQIRGGSGLFTGRIPFVWLSNQYSNTGVQLSNVNLTTIPNGFAFNATTPPTSTSLSKPTINVIDPNFKLAQTWRSNLAVDLKLPFGITATVEGIY